MKFARIGEIDRERPVIVDGDSYFDLLPVTPDIDGAFLKGDGIDLARRALAAGELSKITNAREVRVGAAIARPSAVLCIGMNYAAHAAESGSRPPTVPILFLKTPNTVVGPTDSVAIPRNSKKTDWEVELGVVVGKRASYLDSPADSISHIAGFVTTNDLSEREFQLEISGAMVEGEVGSRFQPDGPMVGHS